MANTVRLHVGPAGTVWYGDDRRAAADSGAAPEQFVEGIKPGAGGKVCDDGVTEFRLLGTPANARLIVELVAWHYEELVVVGAPDVVPKPDRGDAEIVLQCLRQPPEASRRYGCWNRLDRLAAYCTFRLMAEIAQDGVADVNRARPVSRDHPAWGVVSFAAGDPAAACRTLCTIGDPRWYTHRDRPSRLNRLYTHLGLTETNAAAYAHGEPERRGYRYAAAEDAFRLWAQEPLARLVDPLVLRYGAVGGLLHTTRLLVALISRVWSDAVAPHSCETLPFDPYRFFTNPAVAEAFSLHQEAAGR